MIFGVYHTSGISRKYFNAPSSRFIDTLSFFEALLCSLTALPHPSTHPHYPLALFQLLTLPRRTLTPPPPNIPSIYPHRHPTPICHPKTLHNISYTAFSLPLMPFIGPLTFSRGPLAPLGQLLPPFHCH